MSVLRLRAGQGGHDKLAVALEPIPAMTFLAKLVSEKSHGHPIYIFYIQ